MAWQVEQLVQEMMQNTKVPNGGLPGALYVPEEERTEVLQWGQAFKQSSRTVTDIAPAVPMVLVAIYGKEHPPVYFRLHGVCQR